MANARPSASVRGLLELAEGRAAELDLHAVDRSGRSSSSVRPIGAGVLPVVAGDLEGGEGDLAGLGALAWRSAARGVGRRGWRASSPPRRSRSASSSACALLVVEPGEGGVGCHVDVGVVRDRLDHGEQLRPSDACDLGVVDALLGPEHDRALGCRPPEPPNSLLEDVEAAGALEARAVRSPGRSRRRCALEMPPTTRTRDDPQRRRRRRGWRKHHEPRRANTRSLRGEGRQTGDRGRPPTTGINLRRRCDGAIGDCPGCDGCHQGFSSASLGFRPHDPGPLPRSTTRWPSSPARAAASAPPPRSRSPRPGPTSCCRRARRSSSTRWPRRSRRVGRTAVVVPADLSDLDAVAGLAEIAAAELGRIDIVVNNVGGTHAPPVPRHVARAG